MKRGKRMILLLAAALLCGSETARAAAWEEGTGSFPEGSVWEAPAQDGLETDGAADGGAELFGSESAETAAGEGDDDTGAFQDPEVPEACPEEAPEPSGPDDARVSPAEGDAAGEPPAQDPADAAPADGEAAGDSSAQDPAAMVSEEDILAIMGEGVDAGIDASVDAVEEIYAYDPADAGIRQMAAGNAGLLEEDRQNGTAVPFVPADSVSDSMAYVSAFLLARVTDGNGDYDRTADYREASPGCGYDWNGNDSSDHNGVVRTHDEAVYVLCYSTALTEPYIYHTVYGTKLMLEYVLPVSPREASFHLEAMSWMKGADGGRPSLRYEYEDGHVSASPEDGGRVVRQILTGWRELPDETGSEGPYDVPGAGTVNCVVRIGDGKTGQSIIPSFAAWLERASGNDRAVPGYAEYAACRDGISPEIRITSGLWMRSVLSPVSVNQDFDTRTGFGHDGRTEALEGRRHAFQYKIYNGKPNGSDKGTDSLKENEPVTLFFTWSDGATEGYASESLLLEAGTMGSRTGAITGGALDDAAVSGLTFQEKYGQIEPGSLAFADGGFSFRVSGFTDREPNRLVTAGVLFFPQKQVREDASLPHYWVTLAAPQLTAVSANGGGTPEMRSLAYTSADGSLLIPEARSENTLEASGRWHAHVMLKTPGGGSFLKGTGFSMDSSVVLGSRFNVWSIRWWKVTSEASSERAANGFLLWDNRKFRIAENADGEPAFVQFVQKMGQYSVKLYYITKADGTAWSGEDEMKQAELLAPSVYEKLRFWPSYREAVGYLKSRGMEDGSHICGILTEIRGISKQSPGVEQYQCTKIDLETLPDESLIGTSGIFTHSWITWRSDPGTTMGSADGRGAVPDLPDKEILKKYYIDAPRTYTGTRWTREGAADPQSLTADNHYHQGNSLYIKGWRYAIAETFDSGLEAMAVDPAAEKVITCVLKPSFADGSRGDGASCLVEAPSPGAPLSLKEVYLKKPDGSVTVLREGESVPVSEYSEGGTGTVCLSKGEMEYAKYTGRTYYLSEPASGLELAEEGGVPCLRPHQETASHQWYFEEAGGCRRLKNAGSGLYLTAPAGSVGDNAALIMSKALTGDAEARQLFAVSGEDESRIGLIYTGNGTLRAGAGSGGAAVLGTAAASWKLLPGEGSGKTGFRVFYEGLTSAAEIPEIFAVYELDASAAAGHEPVVFQAAVSGDGFEPAPSKANGHLAAVSLSFVDISASVLKETVDKKIVVNGEELLYTIRYENLNEEGHALDLLWTLPADQDADGTILSEGAVLTVGEPRAEADSSLELEKLEGSVRVTGKLHSGEAVEIQIPVTVTGGGTGDVIRSHAVQQEPFGPVLSNRVETRLLMPYKPVLMTGGEGCAALQQTGTITGMLGLCLLLGLRRRRPRRRIT